MKVEMQQKIYKDNETRKRMEILNSMHWLVVPAKAQ